MGDAVYAIDAFPDDDFHWRLEWMGGLGYNTSAPPALESPGLLCTAPSSTPRPDHPTDNRRNSLFFAQSRHWIQICGAPGRQKTGDDTRHGENHAGRDQSCGIVGLQAIKETGKEPR